MKEKGIAGLLKSESFRKFVIDFRSRIVSVTVTKKKSCWLTELQCKVRYGLPMYKGFFGRPRQR